MKLIVNINLRVCYVAQVYVDTDGNVLQKAISTVNTVESGNLHSVTSNAVANYTPNKSYGVVARNDQSGLLGGTGSFSYLRYVRIATGSWNACNKIFIQFEGGNMADRIEISILTGNTNNIQCFGLYASNSGCVKEIFLCSHSMTWDSVWDLYIGLVTPYDTTVYIKKIVDYYKGLDLVVDNERTTEPPNIIKRITLSIDSGFFHS